jgi:hypothetical protein
MKTKVTYQEKTVTFIDYNENGSIKKIRKFDKPQQQVKNSNIPAVITVLL